MLDTAMMGIYEETLAKFEANLRANCPILLGLFTGEGGEFALYQPGHDPVYADPVPIGYQIVKSAGHSAMAVYQLIGPYLGDPENPSWPFLGRPVLAILGKLMGWWIQPAPGSSRWTDLKGAPRHAPRARRTGGDLLHHRQVRGLRWQRAQPSRGLDNPNRCRRRVRRLVLALGEKLGVWRWPK
jgi:hypothetical protein